MKSSRRRSSACMRRNLGSPKRRETLACHRWMMAAENSGASGMMSGMAKRIMTKTSAENPPKTSIQPKVNVQWMKDVKPTEIVKTLVPRNSERPLAHRPADEMVHSELQRQCHLRYRLSRNPSTSCRWRTRSSWACFVDGGYCKPPG